MAYAIIKSDRIQATKTGNIDSVKFYVGATPTVLENGNVVALLGLVAGEREIMKGVAPVAVTDEVVLVAGVELMYDESTKKGLDDYINVAGQAFRAYHLEAGDIFTISDTAITALAAGTPVVGNVVVAAVGVTKLKELAAVVGTERFVGKVIAKEIFGVRGIAMTTIQVVKS